MSDTPAGDGIAGANPFTVVSPVRSGHAPVLRATLLAGQVAPSVPLARLELIHSAHWSVVTGLPSGRPGVAPIPLGQPLLVFVSDFDGSWLDYVDVFAESSPGRGLADYLSPAMPTCAAYYRAHPHPTRQVVAAQRVCRHLDGLRRDSLSALPGEFWDHYSEVRTRTQAASGPHLERRMHSARSDWRYWRREVGDWCAATGPSIRPTTWAVTTLTPVADLDGLVAALGSLRFDDGACPFERGSTRFARFVGDAPARRWMAQVWTHCAGLPGDATDDLIGFARYLSSCRVPTSLTVDGYPGGVGQVRAALERAERFESWAVDHQAADPVGLLADFRMAMP